jgi:hypothetical protein
MGEIGSLLTDFVQVPFGSEFLVAALTSNVSAGGFE